MARTYHRDSRGRFAGGGSAGTRRALRSRLGTSATAERIRRNAVSGTAKPAGTISGTKLGRSKDQFSRETQAMLGRKIGAKVKREAPSLREAAKAAGFRVSSKRTRAPRLLRDNVFMSSAPYGTIPKRDPGMAIPTSQRQRRTAAADDSSRRRPRRSKATAAKADAAGAVMVRGDFSRSRSRVRGVVRRRR